MLHLDGDKARLAAGNVRLAAGNAHLAAGNARLAAGNVRLAAGNAHLAAGNEHLAAGNEHLAAGNARLAAGDVRLAADMASPIVQPGRRTNGVTRKRPPPRRGKGHAQLPAARRGGARPRHATRSAPGEAPMGRM
jgi:X-X-X-Leu-X-X-Gly heptad repeat protein